MGGQTKIKTKNMGVRKIKKKKSKRKSFFNFIFFVLAVIIIVYAAKSIYARIKSDGIENFAEEYTVDGIRISDISADLNKVEGTDNKIIISAIATNTTDEFKARHMINCEVIEKTGKKIHLIVFIDDLPGQMAKPIKIHTNFNIKNIDKIVFE